MFAETRNGVESNVKRFRGVDHVSDEVVHGAEIGFGLGCCAAVLMDWGCSDQIRQDNDPKCFVGSVRSRLMCLFNSPDSRQKIPF